MRVFYIVLIVMMIPAVGIAQEATDSTADSLYNDVVVLDNGGKVQGRIIENRDEGDKIKVEMRDGTIVEIPRHRVFHITTTEFSAESQKAVMALLNETRSPNPTPFKYVFAVGISTFSKKAAVAVSGLMAGRVRSGTLAGLIMQYDMTEGGLLSVGGHIRHYLSDNVETLFPYGEIGGAVITSSSTADGTAQGGVFLAGGIGYRISAGSDHRLQIKAGLRCIITMGDGIGVRAGMFSLMVGAII